MIGIRDAITFKDVDETIVNTVEEYVKKELADIIKTWEKNDIKVNHEDFYGEFYVFCPEAFKFSIGDRLQIKKMVAYVKKKYDENGVEFSGAHEFQPCTSIKQKSKNVNGKSTRFFGDNATKNPATTCQYTEIVDKDQKHVLIEKITKIYKNHGIDSHLIGKLNTDLIEIQEYAEGKIRALFNCPLCGSSNKENRFVIQTKQNKNDAPSNKIYWVLSNYTTHVLAHVKNSAKFASKIDSDPSTTNESAIEITHGNDQQLDEIMHEVIVENYDDDEEEQIVDNSIEIVEIFMPPSNNELSYNDLESLIYGQITSQLNEMHGVSMANEEREKQKNFVIDGVVCTMKVNTTKPDGACFFRACDHQLNKNKLESRKHTMGTNKLRKDIVEYIKQHRKSFDSEIRGSVYDWYESMGKSTKNIPKFSKVCNDFLSKELPKQNFWAGSESLKAMTLDKSVNILILVNNGISYFSNGFNDSYTKTIILAYCTYSNESQTETEHTDQKLNHYDSVVHIEPSDVYLLSKHLATIAAKRNAATPAATDLRQSPSTANET